MIADWFQSIPYPLINLFHLPIFLAVFAKILILPVFLAVLIRPHLDLRKEWNLYLLLACIGVLGYLSFWVFYLNRYVGWVVNGAGTIVLAGFIIALFLSRFAEFRRRVFDFIGDPEVKWPLLLWFGLSTFSICFLYSVWYLHVQQGKPVDDLISLRLIGAVESPDYRVQLIYLLNLFSGDSIWGRVLGEIQQTTVADRPPLVAGISLFSHWFSGYASAQFYPAAMITQFTWVFAAWQALRLAGISAAKVALWILFFSQSGFFFFHSLFAWPKHLSGAFLIGTFLILIQSRLRDRTISKHELILASVLAALGCLSHNSVSPILIPIAVILMLPRFRLSWRQMGVGAFVFLAIQFPWGHLKGKNEKDYPHGVRLLVAGQYNEARHKDVKISHLQAAVDAYSQYHSLSDYIEHKKGQFKTIWSFRRVPDRTGLNWLWGTYEMVWNGEFRRAIDVFRHSDRNNIVASLGLLFLSVPLLLARALRRRFFKNKKELETDNLQPTRYYFLPAIVTILITHLVAFDFPIMIQILSFGSMFLLFFGMAIDMSRFSPRWLYGIYWFNLVYFTVIWWFGNPVAGQSWHYPYLVLCIAAFVATNSIPWIIQRGSRPA